MRTSDAFVGLDCVDCGARTPPEEGFGRCDECGGILDPVYEHDEPPTRETFGDRPIDSMWRYHELLPYPREAAVTLGEGGTPLTPAPSLAERMGVDRVFIKDEGDNPTGTFKDRGQTMAMTAAVQAGADEVSLPSAGNAGHSMSAYAARAGLPGHVYLPEQAGYTQKAMVEVHGSELTTVPGSLSRAGAAHNEAAEAEGWHPLTTFVTPYRHEGKKTMLYETVEQLDWEVPDAVVYPTGGGVGLVGMHKAATEFQEFGLTDGRPAMYAAQSTGCAPVVRAWEEGKDVHEAWEDPDTVCNGIEVPDPGASPLILDAVRESGGGAVATDDEAILDAAIEVARREGVEMGGTCAAAASGAFELADRGEFDADDTVVLLNTGAGFKDVDLLRGHVGDEP
ncbi:MAG: threonine synthase [Haloferacaceae archaeon]